MVVINLLSWRRSDDRRSEDLPHRVSPDVRWGGGPLGCAAKDREGVSCV